MKVAVVGKGGVGKTFVAGTLAKASRKYGETVIAIDADPSMNLFLEFGIDPEEMRGVTPISENQDLIREKTGVAVYEGTSTIYNLNPTVDDIVEEYSIESPQGIRLLVMGTVRSAGQGCMCPANALLRALLRHILLRTPATVIVDVEAGLEPFGRGTIEYVDVILNIVEPSTQSIETSVKIYRLASEVGIGRHLLIANKVGSEDERMLIEEALAEHGLKLNSVIPYDEDVRARAMRYGISRQDMSSPAVEEISRLARRLRSGEEMLS
ncbi:AAA family ATPase [Candidatus Bathyarchaeota archaeon]|nr:AAA family ATPase [Candidatus Bathyarchaeota archaeon]